MSHQVDDISVRVSSRSISPRIRNRSRSRSSSPLIADILRSGSSEVLRLPTSLWLPQHEKLLAKWKAKLFVQMWLQERSMYFYRDLNNYLSYPIIVISSVSSATLLATKSEVIKYFIGGLSLTTGILTAISRQMRPAELYQQHATATLRYQALIRTIDTCLSMPISMRDSDPKTFLQKIELDMATLNENQVNPPPFIIRKFERKFNSSIDKLVYGEEILALLRADMLKSSEHTRSTKLMSRYFRIR